MAKGDRDPFNPMEVRESIYKEEPYTEQQKLFKRAEIQCHIEEMMAANNEDTHDFLTNIDPRTDPSKIKALYFYQMGADKQYREVQKEVLKKFLNCRYSTDDY